MLNKGTTTWRVYKGEKNEYVSYDYTCNHVLRGPRIYVQRDDAHNSYNPVSHS